MYLIKADKVNGGTEYMMTGQEVFNYIGIDMGWVLIGAVAVCLLMLILIMILFIKNSNLKKTYRSFMAGEDGKSLEKVIIERFKEIDELNSHIKIVDDRLNRIDGILLHTYEKMALRKYDAFQEMGGELSFVLVMLTASNDGYIVNVMHSTREGCYIYAKNVVNGKCDIELSEEESLALEEAMRK